MRLGETRDTADLTPDSSTRSRTRRPSSSSWRRFPLLRANSTFLSWGSHSPRTRTLGRTSATLMTWTQRTSRESRPRSSSTRLTLARARLRKPTLVCGHSNHCIRSPFLRILHRLHRLSTRRPSGMSSSPRQRSAASSSASVPLLSAVTSRWGVGSSTY